jgi:3-oxoacyl-[acyl-carrier protein] reductase
MRGNILNFFLTGCASGIARHLTEVLLREGHHVFATDINLEALQSFSRSLNVPESQLKIARLDVSQAQSWEEVFQQAVTGFGSIDVTMNIAGYMKGGWVIDAPAEEVHRNFDINTKGVIFGTQVSARHMQQRRSGHIINISSMSGLAPIPGIALYSASKFAVRAFSLAAAQELRQYGIYITVICPDAVNTPLLNPNRNNDAAALVFSGDHLLTVQDIERAIMEKALPRKPLEIDLPESRAWLARLTDAFPSLILKLAPHYQKKGLNQMSR